MNAPAVPRYVIDVAAGFDGCPPGHRFNLYFPIWREADWQIDKNGKAATLRQSLKLGDAAGLLEAAIKRQQTLAEALPEECHFILEARATAPFATGLGLEHPVENGFAFLSPYGLPYLAGSGIKGVLRRAAEEMEDEGSLAAGTVESLFGHEDATDARRGGLTCWDVFPVQPKGELVVEIMTPHFGHYYQEGGTPHDAGKPNPIPFLAVPAGSAFRFVFTCEPGQTDSWKTDLMKIIEHAFNWLGFGAKTAVGYGAMEEDAAAKVAREQRETAAREAVERQAREALREKMTPEERAWESHQPLIETFRGQHEAAKPSPYKPGSLFDNQRNEFVKAALAWEDSRSRKAAGELLKETLTKAWGTPGNKDSKQRLKEAVDMLNPGTP